MTYTVTGGAHIGQVGQTDDAGVGRVGIGVVSATSLGVGIIPGTVLGPGEIAGISDVVEVVFDMMIGVEVERREDEIGIGVVSDGGVLTLGEAIGVDGVLGVKIALVSGGGVLRIEVGVVENITVGEDRMLLEIVTGTTGVLREVWLSEEKVLDTTIWVGVEEIVVEMVAGVTEGVVSVCVSVSTSLVDFVSGMMLVLMKDVVEVKVTGITEVVEPMEMVLRTIGLVLVIIVVSA